MTAIMGIVDLLEHRDGKVHIVDFKSGHAAPEHHDQVLLYSLIWWRLTGELPGDGELRYAGRTEPVPVSAKTLEAVEATMRQTLESLSKTLKTKAKGVVGAHCHHCTVRQFCEAYWASKPPLDTDWADVEVEVQSVSPDGLQGKTLAGQELTFVLSPDAWLPGNLVKGTRLRVLGVGREKDAEVKRMTRMTEVFVDQ